jgi:tetratricopeptide (TPR) repeat protein
MVPLRRIGLSVLMVLFLSVGLCYGQNTPEQIMAMGVQYGAQGKFKEAKEEFEKVLEGKPYRDEVTDHSFRRVTIAKGTIEIYLQVTADAIDERISSKTAIHLFKGIERARGKQFNEAIEEFKRAIEINPSYAPSYHLRGGARRI